MADDSTPGVLRRYAGGVGRNIAENLSRLGCETSLVSAIGDDLFGRRVLNDLQQIGVDVSYIALRQNGSTASYTAVHDCDGELLHAISDMRLFDEFQLSVESGVVPQEMLEIIDAADAVVLDANLPESALTDIVGYCQSTMLYADGVSRSKCTRLSGVLDSLSLLKVNRAEAIALTGVEVADDEDLLDALRKLGPEQVLLTSGDDGVVLVTDGEVYRAEALPGIDVVSTSGAGDAMLSGVIAAALAGLSVELQLQCGMRTAAETLGVYSACSEKLSREFIQQ